MDGGTIFESVLHRPTHFRYHAWLCNLILIFFVTFFAAVCILTMQTLGHGPFGCITLMWTFGFTKIYPLSKNLMEAIRSWIMKKTGWCSYGVKDNFSADTTKHPSFDRLLTFDGQFPCRRWKSIRRLLKQLPLTCAKCQPNPNGWFPLITSSTDDLTLRVCW